MNAIDPELYALVHDGAPGDLDFYRAFSAGTEHVLELGAGFARVAIAIAETGPRVTGIELDDAMRGLGHARIAASPAAVRERVTLRAGDMAAFALEPRFDRIVIPFSGIYCLLDEGAVRGCLAAAARHLAPGGRLAFDAYAADQFHEESRPEDYADDQRELVAEIEHRGVPLAVFEQSRWDRDAHRLDAHYRYVGPDGEVVHEHTLGHRYLLADELPSLLDSAGLELVSLSGSFEGEPYDGAGSLVVVAERRGAP